MGSNKVSPFGKRKKRSITGMILKIFEWISLPITIFALLHPSKTNSAYKLSIFQRQMLGLKIYRNSKKVWTGISYRAHLVMAQKLLSMSPNLKGAVVECGCFRGGTTANLSLLCEIVDRELIVYDSFAGMPAHSDGDQYSRPGAEGFLAASLDEVQDHVARYGKINRCRFVKGYFADTLPEESGQIAFMFLDVDYQSSMYDCVIHLWPRLHDKGFVFIDEYVLTDFCALFYSEKFWQTHFDRTPPGLIGAGSGLPLGNFYTGPYGSGSPVEQPAGVAYTRKHFSGYWGYYPEAQANQQ